LIGVILGLALIISDVLVI